MLIALPFALVLAWAAPNNGPSRAELAQALSRADGRTVPPDEIRNIDCATTAGEGGSHACRWQQREAGAWQPHAARLGGGADGWHVVTGAE